MKKIFSFIFSLFLLSSTLINSIPVYANTKSNSNDVIAIVDGISITKNDVDENGLIKNEVIEQNDKTNNFKKFKRYSTPSTMNLSKGSTNALVIKTQSAPRFYQQVDYYYLNAKNATTFAYKLTGSSSTNSAIVNFLIGALISFKTSNPWVGLTYSAVTLIPTLRNNAVRDKILNYSNKGYPVEVRVIKNSYGTYYYVGKWNGKTINIQQSSDTKLRFVNSSRD